MYILGISCFYHDSAAVLLHDGQLLAACEEERFTRIKFDFVAGRAMPTGNAWHDSRVPLVFIWHILNGVLQISHSAVQAFS
jgi:hypothetical protein